MLSKHLIDEAVDGLKTWKIGFKANISDYKILRNPRLLVMCVQSNDVKDAIYKASATTQFHEWYKSLSRGSVHKLMSGDGVEDALTTSNLLGSMIDRLSGESLTMTPLHNLFYDHGQ